MKPKLTPWFDWPVKPTIEGWYDTRMQWFGTVIERHLWWDGTDFWDNFDHTDRWWYCPGDQWRGLAEKLE